MLVKGLCFFLYFVCISSTRRLCSSLTMDIIARTSFGIRTDSQTDPNDPFIVNAKKIFDFQMTNPLILAASKLENIFLSQKKIQTVKAISLAFGRDYGYLMSLDFSVLTSIWDSRFSVNNGLDCLLMSWWRHQTGAFSALLALCAGNPPINGGFLSQRSVTRSFDVFFIRIWTNGFASNRDAGDLRRHRAHYDITVAAVSHFHQLSQKILGLAHHRHSPYKWLTVCMSSQWRHVNVVSIHWQFYCSLNRLFMRTHPSKHQSSTLLALCEGNHRWPMESHTIGQ